MLRDREDQNWVGHMLDSHCLQAARVSVQQKQGIWGKGFLHRITIRWNLDSSSQLLLQLVMFIVRTPPDWEHMFSTPFSGVCKQFIAGKGAACLHSVPTVPINLPHPSPLQSKELLSCHYKLYTSHIYDKKQLNTKYWGNLFWQVLIWHSSPTDQISS